MADVRGVLVKDDGVQLGLPESHHSFQWIPEYCSHLGDDRPYSDHCILYAC